MGNVYTEELDRLRKCDLRIIFLRIPPEEYEQLGIKKFLARTIKGSLFIDMKSTDFAKIGFRNMFEKSAFLNENHKKQILWPNTKTHLIFKDPQKTAMDGGYNILNYEAIDTELLFISFKIDGSEAKLMKELTMNFPGWEDYKINPIKSELVVTFK